MDNEKDKKPNLKKSFLLTGPPGAGKTETMRKLIEELAAKGQFGQTAKPILVIEGMEKTDEKTRQQILELMNKGFSVSGFGIGNSEDYKKLYRDTAFSKPFKAMNLEPMTKETQLKIIDTMVTSGSYSLGKGFSKGEIALELQKPENKDLGLRDVVSSLTEKGMIVKKVHKTPKPS